MLGKKKSCKSQGVHDLFDLDSSDDTPKSSTFSKEHFLDASPSERTKILMSAVKKLLSDNTYEYVLGKKRDDAHRVLVYGKELLSLGDALLGVC